MFLLINVFFWSPLTVVRALHTDHSEDWRLSLEGQGQGLSLRAGLEGLSQGHPGDGVPGEGMRRWSGEPGCKAQAGAGICVEQNGVRTSPFPEQQCDSDQTVPSEVSETAEVPSVVCTCTCTRAHLCLWERSK